MGDGGYVRMFEDFKRRHDAGQKTITQKRMGGETGVKTTRQGERNTRKIEGTDDTKGKKKESK